MKQTKLNEIKQTDLELILPPMGEGKTSIMKPNPKRVTPYHGHNSAEFTHNNKFHTSASHAFRDVDYASAVERDRRFAEFRDMVDYAVLFVVVVALIYVVRYVIM